MINLRYRKQLWKEVKLVKRKEMSSAGSKIRLPTMIFEYSRTDTSFKYVKKGKEKKENQKELGRTSICVGILEEAEQRESDEGQNANLETSID